LQALVAFVDEFYILAVVFLDSSTRFSEWECRSVAADEIRFVVDISRWATYSANEL
jgi:hypothetical protein